MPLHSYSDRLRKARAAMDGGNLTCPQDPCIQSQAGHADSLPPCRDKLNEAKVATGGVDAREDEEVKEIFARLPATLPELVELASELEAEAEGIQLGNPRVVRRALRELHTLEAEAEGIQLGNRRVMRRALRVLHTLKAEAEDIQLGNP